MTLEELIEEALTESTFSPGSDYESALHWARLAWSLARSIQDTLDTIHGETGI